MSNKYAKTGWKKYEYPPSMIAEEKNEKNMKLSKYQMAQMLEQRIAGKIVTSNLSGDYVTEAEWKAWKVKLDKKKITERLNEEFIGDFLQWLNGKSPYNSVVYDRLVYDASGSVVDKKEVPGCPWGNKPLTCVPGVTEFLDQGLDRRSETISYLTKLKMRGPVTLDECWIYYKYIIRELGITEDSCNEVASLAAYDYPKYWDSKDGEVKTGGPTSTSVPKRFNEQEYHQNWLENYNMAKNNSMAYAEWVYEGCPPGGPFWDAPEDDDDDDGTGLGDPDRGQDRRSQNRRNNRQDRRNPVGGNSFAVETRGLRNRVLSPEERRQSRRRDRRQARRGDEGEEQPDDAFMDFHALSPEDQDFMLATTLVNFAIGLPQRVFIEGGGMAGLAPGGVPIAAPRVIRETTQVNAFGAEQTKKLETAIKDTTKTIREELGSMKAALVEAMTKRDGPPRDEVSDKETHELLKSIDESIRNIGGGPSVRNVIVANQELNVKDADARSVLDEQSLLLGDQVRVLQTLSGDLKAARGDLAEFMKGPIPVWQQGKMEADISGDLKATIDGLSISIRDLSAKVGAFDPTMGQNTGQQPPPTPPPTQNVNVRLVDSNGNPVTSLPVDWGTPPPMNYVPSPPNVPPGGPPPAAAPPIIDPGTFSVTIPAGSIPAPQLFNPSFTVSGGEFTGGVTVGQGAFTGQVGVQQGTFTGDVGVQQGAFTGQVGVQQGTFTGDVNVTNPFFQNPEFVANNPVFNNPTIATQVTIDSTAVTEWLDSQGKQYQTMMNYVVDLLKERQSENDASTTLLNKAISAVEDLNAKSALIASEVAKFPKALEHVLNNTPVTLKADSLQENFAKLAVTAKLDPTDINNIMAGNVDNAARVANEVASKFNNGQVLADAVTNMAATVNNTLLSAYQGSKEDAQYTAQLTTMVAQSFANLENNGVKATLSEDIMADRSNIEEIINQTAETLKTVKQQFKQAKKDGETLQNLANTLKKASDDALKQNKTQSAVQHKQLVEIMKGVKRSLMANNKSLQALRTKEAVAQWNIGQMQQAAESVPAKMEEEEEDFSEEDLPDEAYELYPGEGDSDYEDEGGMAVKITKEEEMEDVGITEADKAIIEAERKKAAKAAKSKEKQQSYVLEKLAKQQRQGKDLKKLPRLQQKQELEQYRSMQKAKRQEMLQRNKQMVAQVNADSVRELIAGDQMMLPPQIIDSAKQLSSLTREFNENNQVSPYSVITGPIRQFLEVNRELQERLEAKIGRKEDFTQEEHEKWAQIVSASSTEQMITREFENKKVPIPHYPSSDPLSKFYVQNANQELENRLQVVFGKQGKQIAEVLQKYDSVKDGNLTVTSEPTTALPSREGTITLQDLVQAFGDNAEAAEDSVLLYSYAQDVMQRAVDAHTDLGTPAIMQAVKDAMTIDVRAAPEKPGIINDYYQNKGFFQRLEQQPGGPGEIKNVVKQTPEDNRLIAALESIRIGLANPVFNKPHIVNTPLYRAMEAGDWATAHREVVSNPQLSNIQQMDYGLKLKSMMRLNFLHSEIAEHYMAMERYKGLQPVAFTDDKLRVYVNEAVYGGAMMANDQYLAHMSHRASQVSAGETQARAVKTQIIQESYLNAVLAAAIKRNSPEEELTKYRQMLADAQAYRTQQLSVLPGGGDINNMIQERVAETTVEFTLILDAFKYTNTAKTMGEGWAAGNDIARSISSGADLAKIDVLANTIAKSSTGNKPDPQPIRRKLTRLWADYFSAQLELIPAESRKNASTLIDYWEKQQTATGPTRNYLDQQTETRYVFDRMVKKHARQEINKYGKGSKEAEIVEMHHPKTWKEKKENPQWQSKTEQGLKQLGSQRKIKRAPAQ